MVSVKKSTVERYDLRGDDFSWAVFTISDDGQLNIQSDYGNYQYWWGSPGMPFKQFLCKISTSYLIDKLSGGERYFDLRETCKRIADDILKHLWKIRNDYNTDREQARESARDAWWDVGRLRDECPDDNAPAFYMMYHETHISNFLGDDYLYDMPIVETSPIALMEFAKTAWSAFVEVLRKEIDTLREQPAG